jgi:hypothetical protein
MMTARRVELSGASETIGLRMNFENYSIASLLLGS